MPDPNDPRDAGTYDELRTAGRELSPEEQQWMEEYEAALQGGGEPMAGAPSGPMGGSVGGGFGGPNPREPMQPGRGALHME